MAKKIELWESKDHARFDTEDEAVAHDAQEQLVETCKVVGWHPSPVSGMDDTSWHRIALWLTEARPIVESFFDDLPEDKE